MTSKTDLQAALKVLDDYVAGIAVRFHRDVLTPGALPICLVRGFKVWAS
jgi:hypothetical protein